MGFWSSFLGNAAANAVKESRKEEERHKKWNELFDEAQKMENDFNNFLEKVGIDSGYVFDVNILNKQGEVNEEKRKLDNYRRKINKFISLGGDVSAVWNYEDITDDCIEKIKYLKSVNRLDEQRQYLDWNIDAIRRNVEADNKISNDLKEIEQQINAIQADMEKMLNIARIGCDIDSMDGVEFESLCQVLVELMGFSTESTKASGDGGIDIIAYNYQPIISGKYIIQCKRYSGSVGEPIIRDLYGVVMSERANKGILITTGYFTNHALNFAEGKPIELIDGQKLNELLEQYLNNQYI